MAVTAFQRQVATIALEVAAAHGFALAGGSALIMHGVVDRPTADVDLFTDRKTGVRDAADVVEAALVAAGFTVVRVDKTAGLSDVFYGMGDGLAEWEVRGRRRGQAVILQMSYFERERPAVVMDVGPVLALDDLAGRKVCALATRVEARDYVDVAALLERYTAAELMAWARRLDPGLSWEEFADAAQRLDSVSDGWFVRAGFRLQDAGWVRAQFATWPR